MNNEIIKNKLNKIQEIILNYVECGEGTPDRVINQIQEILNEA